MKRFVCTMVVLLGVLLFFGCSNPDTPAGHEGYVTQSAIVGSVRFYGTQIGPSSPGLRWLLGVVNIDMQWKTYDEPFDVMTVDDLLVKFSSHLVIRPKGGSVKAIVEQYGGLLWYQRVIKEPYRNAIYASVSGHKALEIKERRKVIAEESLQRILDYLADKPFEVQTLVVGTITFPDVVADAQAQKIRKQTELEQKQFELSIAHRDAEIRIEQAKGIAEAQRIIANTLTPAYLQHEAIEAQRAMANSSNHTTVYIPSGANGIPLVFDAGER